jgi:hypothetical protein
VIDRHAWAYLLGQPAPKEEKPPASPLSPNAALDAEEWAAFNALVAKQPVEVQRLPGSSPMSDEPLSSEEPGGNPHKRKRGSHRRPSRRGAQGRKSVVNTGAIWLTPQVYPHGYRLDLNDSVSE